MLCAALHISGIGARQRHSYTVEVRASREAAGHFTWLIRDHGKLRRGSYRPHPSEEEARAVAEAEIQCIGATAKTD